MILFSFLRWLVRLLPMVSAWGVSVFGGWWLLVAGGFVAAFVLMLDKIVLGIATLGAAFIKLGLIIFLRLATWGLGLLPDIPEDWPTIAWNTIYGFVGPANRYIPLDVAFRYAGLYLAVQAAILTWHFVKFVRGGG